MNEIVSEGALNVRESLQRSESRVKRLHYLTRRGNYIQKKMQKRKSSEEGRSLQLEGPHCKVAYREKENSGGKKLSSSV